MTVAIEIDVRDTFSPALRRLMMRTGSLNECLDKIGGSLVTSTQKRFEDEKTPEGNDWQQHSDATIARRGPGASILRHSTDLFVSIDHKVESSKVLVGTNRIYGRIQQLGGEAGRVNARVTIPARPYLGISSDDETEIHAIITDHLGVN
jgi:phage virion morphogenesis protein